MEQISSYGALSGSPIPEFLPTTVRRDLSTDEHRGVRYFVEAYDQLSRYVLERVSCADVERLDDTVDLILEDGEYLARRHELAQLMPWSALRRVVGKKDPSHTPIEGVPPIVSPKVQLALKTELELMRTMFRFISLVEGVSLGEEQHPQAATVENFLDAPMPSQMRAAFIAHRIGEICGMALASELVTSARLADALADRWLHGLRSTLAIFASLLGVRLSTKVLPAEYVVDRDDMEREIQESRESMLYAAEQVERTGKGYPEVYVADDEEDP